MRVSLAIALIAALLLVGGCKRNRGGEAAPSSPAVQERSAFKVRTVAVSSGPLTVVREASGRIEPERDVRVAARTGGKVTAVPVREGDRVARGDVLVRLDERDPRDRLRQAQLALEQARLNRVAAERRLADQEAQLTRQLQAARQNLANAEKRLDEARALLPLGGVAPVEVDQLAAAVAQAAANAAAAEAAYRRWQRSKDEDLAQLRLQVEQAQVAVDQARTALEDTRITAPFAGRVAARFVDAGAFVGPGSPVVQLVAGPRNVVFKLPPDEVARLDPTELTLLFLGRRYPLELLRSAPVPGPDRLISLYARPLEGGDELPFGGAVLLRYRLVLASGPRVPATALRVREGRSYVFAASGGRARAVPVEVVAEAEGWAVVRGAGLPERVVHPLPQDLRDGSYLEVLE
ncbi:biotin/lipoyl-binding protein [Oceanithermus sp.]|uniref:efflux RND transporter periplasmic adaptor subunit n=1 Tax=Oceanithermus sp. TaxID=2268145 RepID=UPI0025807154|nr:biotin/lipoyl-binding protein [Oceanithermus sp.]